MESMKKDREQLNNSPKKWLIAGGLVIGTIVMFNTVATLGRVFNPVRERVIDQPQVLESPTHEASPEVLSSINKRQVTEAQRRLEIAGDYLVDVSDKFVDDLITARAKRWLIYAGPESAKKNQSESEYLANKLAYFEAEFRHATNNGSLDPKPDNMDRAMVNLYEALAIKRALTEVPAGGANPRINGVNVLNAIKEFKQKVDELNNVQMSEAGTMTTFPAYGEVVDQQPVEETGNAKAIEGEVTDEQQQ